MDSKTRAKLRSLASNVDSTVIIGKDGITDNVISQISMELDAKELVKISVLAGGEDYRSMLEEISTKLSAEPVCHIGKKLVVYRYSSKKNVKHVLEA